MAYRFNPPPNWQIDDASWSPPPGWQPDPSWGPAPEGWNFWIPEEPQAAAAEPASQPSVPEDAEPQDTSDSQDIDAGTVISSAPADEQPVPSPSEEAGAEQDHAEAPATDEYPGPDLEADLAQQAPYESAEPEPYGAAAPQGASEPAPYGSPAPYSPAPYGSPASAQTAGYDEQHQGYGTPSGSDYPASPAFGQDSASSMAGSPATDSGWTATTATGEAPKKGALARFWWVGCIVLFLVVALIVAVVGGIFLFRDDAKTAGGDGETTTTQAETTPEEEATSDSEEPVSPEPTTDLPVIGDGAEAKDITGENGSGSLAVQTEWKKAEDLPSSYGGTVKEAQNGEYLVVTAELTVTEGQMAFPSYYFQVMTPYGGAVDESSESYGLANSGRDYDTSYEFTEGETYTIVLLYDFVRAGGNTLQYDNYVDVYTWDIPA